MNAKENKWVNVSPNHSILKVMVTERCIMLTLNNPEASVYTCRAGSMHWMAILLNVFLFQVYSLTHKPDLN